MTELKFDTEGITDCPMKGKATSMECLDCIYRKVTEVIECIYKDIFTEEGMGTVDSIMPYPDHYSPGQPAPFCKPGE